jgi:hypothetical protein
MGISWNSQFDEKKPQRHREHREREKQREEKLSV